MIMSKIKNLKKKYKISNLDFDCLLGHVLKCERAFLYTHPEIELTGPQLKKLQALLKRRAQGEPVAYLVGRKDFFGLDFIVNKNVLIPRPETEILVEEVFKKNNIKTVADIGTGSGCIAIALAKTKPNLKVYAIDISSAALKIAKLNAKKHQVKIKFLQGNLLEPIKNKKIDVLVANLPYLDTKLRGLRIKLETRGLKFEPARALYAGPKGLNCFLKFFQQIKKYGLTPKKILLEIGYSQAKEIKKIAQKHLPNYYSEIKNDLAGFNRAVILTRVN